MNLNALCAFDVMPYIADIVVAVVLLIFVLSCAKKGFITCLFGFLSTIVALFAAFTLASVFVNMTGGLFGLEQTLTTSFVNSFSQIEGFAIEIDPSADLTQLLMEGNMSQILVNYIGENYALQAGDTLGKIVGETVAQFATKLIGGIALFFVLKIVFGLLKKIFNFIAKDGFLGFFNKLLGAAIGLIEGVLFVSIAAAILSMFPVTSAWLANSLILKVIDQINPIMWLITLFMV